MTKPLKATIALGILLSLAYASHAKLDFIPMLDASLALNTAGIKTEQIDAADQQASSNDQSSGQNAYLYAAPNLGFTEIPGLWITPAIEFEYSGANNILLIDDESFIFSKRYNFYYLLGLNYRFTPVWSAKLKGFGRMENTLDAADETVETGFYNYRDLGAWGEICARYGGRLLPMRTRLGYKGYMRRYPNYTNKELIAQLEELFPGSTSELPPDMHEKDINVKGIWLRQELTWGKLPLLTNLEAHFKDIDYTEMLSINEDGTFSHDLRQDNYLELSLELPFLINKYHQLEFDYSHCLRASTQGVYDTNVPVYLENYYNYYQHHIRLLYNFKFAFIRLGGFPLQGSLSLANQRRQYFNRPSVQSGEYMFNDPHWENNTDFGFILRQKLLAKWFNVFMSFHAISQTSNTDAPEGTASSTYQYNTFTLGTAVSF